MCFMIILTLLLCLHRLMLQLSQKTNGVIVTNDNLRDLSDESPAFTDIIKKR